MKRFTTIEFSKKAEAEFTNSNGFMQKICDIHEINKTIFKKHSWKIESEKYRGFNITGWIRDPKDMNKLRKYNFYTRKLYFSDMYGTLFAEFLDLVESSLNSTWILIRATETGILVKSDCGTLLDWSIDQPPEINGSFRKFENEIRRYSSDREYGFYDLADFLFERSKDQGYSLRGVEKIIA